MAATNSKKMPSDAPSVPYGPNNPHPLSTLRTELVWEGKYDEWGSRREVDAAGLAMPLQKIETIDEPRARAESQGLLFDSHKAHLDDFRNMLVWGDNKLVTAALLKDFRGKVDLLYIDPPFDVGADFTMDVPIGDGKEKTPKDQSTLEMVAYRDTWGRGTDSYLAMMYERLSLMKDLLSETGTIWVHCDDRMGAQLKLMLDELFGRTNLINEIVWHYVKYQMRGMSRYTSNWDRLLWYGKSSHFTFNLQTIPLDEPKRLLKKGWDKEKQSIQNVRGPDGKVQYIYMNEEKVDDVWELPYIGAPSYERTGYATQKPEVLLERIIKTASNENDLVADVFCGSGTTGAVAERLGRKWLMADLGRFAIHTSRKRLIDLQRTLHDQGQPYRAFDVFNLGRYERQWWQKERLQGADEDHRRVVLEFYKAEILKSPPSPLIHGRKGPSLCHVDGIDGILTRKEIGKVAAAAKEAGAKEVTCLAWEFEMDLRMECNRLEKELGIKIKLIQIPREIMEKNRTEPPPFLEVATLEAKPIIHKANGKKSVDIQLTKFLPSLAEVPTKELEALQERAVKNGFDFIDFWAVDFDYRNGGPFNHHWQDYRTRKDRSLVTQSDQRYEYSKKGRYTACVKVVDIFGCDTSISVEVDYA